MIQARTTEEAKQLLLISSRSEWRECAQLLTNRQLLKEYRTLKTDRPTIEQCSKTTANMYLGENAAIRLIDYDRGIEACETELKARGYKLDKIKL